MTCSPSRHGWLALCLTLGLITLPCLAGDPPPAPLVAPAMIGCLDDLKKLSPCELEQLFASASIGAQPVGFVRGEVLHLANTKWACWKMRMANNIWKGKHICENGEFVNQWKHAKFIRSRAKIGESFFDGKPCTILEYDEKVPYFGNMRDEVRQVGPTTFLAMVFDKGCDHKLKGFIGLELQCDSCQRGHCHQHVSQAPAAELGFEAAK